jgi:hypothetical protein
MTQAAAMPNPPKHATVPDAADAETDTEPNFDELTLGPPFAIAHDCELVDHGCTATIRCGCGQALRFDLLQAGFKGCPKCSARYTHALLVCVEDNDELVGDAFEVVFNANGVELPDDAGDDAGDDSHPAQVVNPDDGEDDE